MSAPATPAPLVGGLRSTKPLACVMGAYIDRDGDTAGEFTGRKLRTWPIKQGHSTALTTVGDFEVLKAGRDVLAKLKCRGARERPWLASSSSTSKRGKRRSTPCATTFAHADGTSSSGASLPQRAIDRHRACGRSAYGCAVFRLCDGSNL